MPVDWSSELERHVLFDKVMYGDFNADRINAQRGVELTNKAIRHRMTKFKKEKEELDAAGSSAMANDVGASCDEEDGQPAPAAVVPQQKRKRRTKAEIEAARAEAEAVKAEKAAAKTAAKAAKGGKKNIKKEVDSDDNDNKDDGDVDDGLQLQLPSPQSSPPQLKKIKTSCSKKIEVAQLDDE